jgi:hypothetical protein
VTVGNVRSLLLNSLTIIAGLIVASGAAAALLALLFGDIRTFPLTFVIVSLVAFGLGLPVYVGVRADRNDTPLLAAVMGFVIGAVLPAILVISGSAADQESVGGTATVVNGSYTAAGWLEALALVGLFGLLGLCGGLIFWFVVRRPAQTGDMAEEGPSPSPLRTALVSVTAAAVIVTAFYIPEATADRSCHNPLRDGRKSIGQVASFDLRVGVDQWPSIATEVAAFGRSGNWSTTSDVRTDKTFPWLQISLCKEPGTNIFVQGLLDSNEVSFAVYQPQGGSSWLPTFRALYERINARWPARVAFRDEHGNQISAPEWATNLETTRPKP